MSIPKEVLHETPGSVGVISHEVDGEMRHYFATSDGESVLFLYANDRGIVYASQNKMPEMHERKMNPAYILDETVLMQKCKMLSDGIQEKGLKDGVFIPYES